MRVKIVLLVVATLSTAALVASAQQTGFVVTSDAPHVQPDTKAAIVVQPGLKVVPDGATRKNTFFYGRAEPQALWTIAGEPSGLTSQAEQLAQQLAAAKSDSDRDKIKGQLSENLEKQFDERQKRHEQEIKALEAQVKQLKDLVDKRQENRREIIGARLNQIVKEAQGLGW
jgi:enoyl-CoA hydratase/carnithine racemase